MLDLAHFDYEQAAPLGLDVISTQQRNGCSVQDITYNSPKGGKVPAYLIIPAGSGPFAGLIFVHWGQGNRSEFVDEAVMLAKMGVVSLCIDGPHLRPEALRPTSQASQEPQEEWMQMIVDVRRGVDLLIAQPGVDPQRVGYVGHSYGASLGGAVTAIEKRIKAYVLMAGSVSMTDNYRTSTHPLIAQDRASTPPAEWEYWLTQMEPLDAIHYIGHAAPSALLFQFAHQDEFIPEEEARHYEQVASEPKQTMWYNCDHQFNEAARHDRINWLRGQLGLQKEA